MSKQAVIALAEGSMTFGTVENLIEISADAAIGLSLPANHILWDCGQYPVSIGDAWIEGAFYAADGSALVPEPTVDEQIAQLRAAIEAANNERDNAIIELYELMEGGI